MRNMHLVLHGLAIKKHGSAEAVAGIVGLEASEVAQALAAAVSQGRAVEAGGAYMLTPAARVSLGGEYSKVYAAQRADQAFVAAYERFELVNRQLKEIMTAWQTVEVGGQSVANDHADKAYDDAVIGRLGELHERAEAVFGPLSAGVPRLAIYQAKLLAALEHAEDGETEWLSGAKIESYHTVWFELHEDLLRILGRERTE